MITVALIDKHPVVRTGLSIFLLDHFEQIRILQSESVIAFHRHYPDLVPNLIIVGTTHATHPVQANFIGKIKQWYRVETLIVFDERSDESMLTHYLKAGVKGYILKHASLSELNVCVMEVLKGKRYLCNEALEIILDKHFPEKRVPRINEKADRGQLEGPSLQ